MTTSKQSLLKKQSQLASPSEQLRILRETSSVPAFHSLLGRHGVGPLKSSRIEVLQINVGKFCNQVCGHCHVDAGPDRTEMMSREVAERCIQALEATEIPKVDITGGAPELNPHFRWLVEQCRKSNRHVMDRCNLTVLLMKGQEDLAAFLASHRVEMICSLPYFQERETERQRGEGVFQRSIGALRALNQLGYGMLDSGLVLNLVHNPVGAFLPAAQKGLELDFKRTLSLKFGVHFNNLYCIANMPISRFLEFLLRSGNYERYMERLVTSFNPSAVEGLMCRNTVSVGWDGRLYDCDFNQMLEIDIAAPAPNHISIFEIAALEGREITTAKHCFGCTAGAGSSCGGATAAVRS